MATRKTAAELAYDQLRRMIERIEREATKHRDRADTLDAEAAGLAAVAAERYPEEQKARAKAPTKD